MRRKLPLLAAGLIAGATISISAGSPAYACTNTDPPDPVLTYVCETTGNLPDVQQLVDHYYNQVGQIVVRVICDLWTCQ
jgi:hypothetical protein